jgi:indole-3-glycerol phosphate synthase
MDILERIVQTKRAEVDAAARRVPEAGLRMQATGRRDIRPFIDALAQSPDGIPNIIAEIKRASPSKGVICADLDAAAQARAYAAGGAAALSVLTDGPYFKGSLEDLRAARAAVDLPVLRKDFTISAYQICEAAAAGADAVLLIVRILAPSQLRDYLALTRELGLSALVETHTPEEMQTALACGACLVGINNRNLKTFETSLETTLRMAAHLGPRQRAVAESGIRSRADIQRLQAAGIHNFLIGESLVRAPDPAALLQSLRGVGP